MQLPWDGGKGMEICCNCSLFGNWLNIHSQLSETGEGVSRGCRVELQQVPP